MTEENKTNVEEEKEMEISQCEKTSQNKGKNTFLNLLGVSLIDQAIAICVSLVGFLLINNVILKASGYEVRSEYKALFFLIIYIIVNVFYRSVCESSKLKTTVGRKVIK
ncbi:hypothetical protein ACFIJ5_10270 [Haloimpatiens sp. FM7330]|uniref:hypothetical protein n=1 Tax=Haloimpatiens sp. FM7330 TaxID=3298610 RepID=UPI00363F4805